MILFTNWLHRIRDVMERVFPSRFASSLSAPLAHQPWHYLQWLPEIPPRKTLKVRLRWFALGAFSGMVLAVAGSWLPVVQFSLAHLDMFKLKVEEPQIAEQAPAVPEKSWPRDVDIAIARGDQLLDILIEQGLDQPTAFDVIATLQPAFDPRQLKEGHQVHMILEEDASREAEDAAMLRHMNISLSKIEEVNLWRNDAGAYEVQKTKKPVSAKLDWGGAPIKGSLYLTAKSLGIPDSTIIEMIRAYSYDVDFQRDIKEGDTFEVLYEKYVTDQGEFADTGNVLYAQLNTGGQSFKIYRYKDNDGVSRFYNEKGESIVKKFLRTPIDGARITSGYGMRRHPILGYSKMHKGVDFGAPTGTPIYAAGDGIISFAGWKGGYGKFVTVRHNSSYTTAYGHASRIAPGIKPGRKVRQGQVIAYVGSTGRSTGPHLHYEILMSGKHVNPAKVKLTGGDKLAGKELARFQDTRRKYESTLAQMKGAPTQVALR